MERIPLPLVASGIKKLTGSSAPSHHRLCSEVLNGRVPAEQKNNGRRQIRCADLPPKADAADLQLDDPIAWLRAHVVSSPSQTDPPAPEEPPPYDDVPAEYDAIPSEVPAIPSMSAAPAPATEEPEGVIPLGHDRGVFYYFSRSARQVFELSAAAHSKNTMTAMASVPHFWQRSQFKSDKGKIDWDEATDWLMRQCRDVGIYDPDRIRGRGAWIDSGRAVLHLGDRLIVDGVPHGLVLPDSRHIYEAARPLALVDAPPLTTAEANKLVEVCRAPNWHHDIYGLLLAGFIVVAPICGGLAWRPSVWVTGSSGSGKTWLKENIIAPGLAGTALLVQSKTTEPGIRQALGCDARPILFDEAEQEDANAASRMQAVLDLLRQSSSEGGADILKGTSSGKPLKYRIRSCFALSSINVGIVHQADESRITVLALRERDKTKAAENAARDAEANRLVQSTMTPAFAAGLLARSVWLLPVIRANAETFARAVAIVIGSRRTGDQLGALLAGAYALHSDRTIADDAAEAWVRKQDWGEAVGGDVEKDELRLLSHLTQHRVRISQGNGSAIEATIGRLIHAAGGHDVQIMADAADLELKQIGIRLDRREGVDGCWVSTNHPMLKRILADTPWSSGWARALKRLPGAVKSEKTIRFGIGHTNYPTWVPLDVIYGGEE